MQVGMRKHDAARLGSNSSHSVIVLLEEVLYEGTICLALVSDNTSKPVAPSRTQSPC